MSYNCPLLKTALNGHSSSIIYIVEGRFSHFRNASPPKLLSSLGILCLIHAHACIAISVCFMLRMWFEISADIWWLVDFLEHCLCECECECAWPIRSSSTFLACLMSTDLGIDRRFLQCHSHSLSIASARLKPRWWEAQNAWRSTLILLICKSSLIRVLHFGE